MVMHNGKLKRPHVHWYKLTSSDTAVMSVCLWTLELLHVELDK